jgi:hypothetical protein
MSLYPPPASASARQRGLRPNELVASTLHCISRAIQPSMYEILRVTCPQITITMPEPQMQRRRRDYAGRNGGVGRDGDRDGNRRHDAEGNGGDVDGSVTNPDPRLAGLCGSGCGPTCGWPCVTFGKVAYRLDRIRYGGNPISLEGYSTCNESCIGCGIVSMLIPGE